MLAHISGEDTVYYEPFGSLALGEVLNTRDNVELGEVPEYFEQVGDVHVL